MSGDPVTAACARAIARVGKGLPNASIGWLAEVGADEALRPIRELHRVAYRGGDGLTVCAECRGLDALPVIWPCATARLVYSESELAE